MMAATSVFPGFLDVSVSTGKSGGSDENPLESFPLYNIANYVIITGTPVILLMGTFGNVMTIVIMRRMTSGESSSIINFYFTGIAVMDLIVLFFASFKEWLIITFDYSLQNSSSVLCKLVRWLYAGCATISCWYVVCLTLHRAVSVVWPHRVSSLCSARTVLRLIAGIAVFFAALYAHYLFGYDLLSMDTEGGDPTGHQCGMESEDYRHFVFVVFPFIDLVFYSLLPLVCLVGGNSVLVWKLYVSVREAHSKFNTASSCTTGEQRVSTREKAANSVTLTVVVVSVTFTVLTLPLCISYILFYVSLAYSQVSGEEYAQVYLIYMTSQFLADCNSAVNFYLYCLTGRRFREEFINVMCCGRNRRQGQGGPPSVKRSS